MDVDTIVSLSTAPGVGAIAVVRLSGPDCDRILSGLLGADEALPKARQATLADVRDPDTAEVLDRALITRYVAPASFTGEDLVELSCHGGWLVPGLVVDACLRAGARAAEPGEFTKRAYLRGKLDLVQAEAIADLIEARSRALHRAAVGQLERGLSNRVSAMRERLVKVEALLAHHVDFPEEDDPPIPIEDVIDEAGALCIEIEGMLATAPEGELLREGALTVFAGRPNAGKSSLYNALIGEERAIVTKEPGTTRDALESVVQMGGFPFRLIDTAGLRESSITVERMGIEIARSYMEKADVLLFCVADDEGLTDADRSFLGAARSAPVVLVHTKADTRENLPEEDDAAIEVEGLAGRVRVSVETGQGLDQLRQLLPELVYSAIVSSGSDDPVLTRRRHARALERALTEIVAFRAGLLDGLPAEVAATHLRSAETALEELLGVVSVDDVLDVVFREFCVGK
jgi:tRNA modification GTPase